MTGAGIGYATGGGRGAAIGAGIGGGVSGLVAYAMNRAARGPKPLDCGKRKLNRDEQVACAEIAAQQVAVAQQAEAERQAAAATRWLFNRSGQQAVVVDGGRPICVENGQRCFMNPSENWQVNRPVSGQYSVILEVPKGPGMIQLPGEVRSVGSQGWEITAPKEVN
jgi:hypothetical protein